MISFVRSAARARPTRSACTLAPRVCAVILLALTQQGCTSLASERALFLDGWHPGRVTRIDVGAAIGPPLRSDCRKAMSLEASSRSYFALVRYSVSPSRYAERIAPNDGCRGLARRRSRLCQHQGVQGTDEDAGNSSISRNLVKPVPWSVSCAVAGIVFAAAMPALAQQPPQPATLNAASATVTLSQASDAAWQRAVQSRETESQGRRARAEQTAASSLWAAPPAIEMNHLNDRFHSSAGRRETEVGFVWPLWLPGQRDARSAAAEAELRLAQSNTDAARLRIAGQVRESAWKLSAALAEVASVSSQTRYLQQLADDVQRRVNAGDLARADALAARGELLEAEAARSEADQRLNAARAQWRTLTGLDAMPEMVLPSAAADSDTPSPVGDHPELIAATHTVERARKRVDAVSASRRDPPELSLRYREEAPGLGEATQRGIGIGLKIPLGTDGRNAPLQAAAFGELDVAETTEQRLRERQAADVAVARTGLQSAARQLDSTRTRARLLRERAQLIDASFKAGESSLPDLLRAANAAAQAEAALARQQAALGMAHAQLQQALGLFP